MVGLNSFWLTSLNARKQKTGKPPGGASRTILEESVRGASTALDRVEPLGAQPISRYPSSHLSIRAIRHERTNCMNERSFDDAKHHDDAEDESHLFILPFFSPFRRGGLGHTLWSARSLEEIGVGERLPRVRGSEMTQPQKTFCAPSLSRVGLNASGTSGYDFAK
jgi:hypothetical protein